MPTPFVSVLIPVFNAGATLAAAVDSVRAQTLRDWELVLVDDGSHAETRRLIDALAARDSRVRVLHRAHDGIVAALNAGLEAARGRFIARMDADDYSLPDRLEAQVGFLETNRAVGLAGTLVEFGGDRVSAAGYALHVDWMNTLITPEAIALNRFVESPFAHPSVMFRRELAERHGGYRPGDHPEDYELWLRWLDAGVVMAKVPRILLRWNDPPARLSRTDPRYSIEAFYRCKADYLARWLRNHVPLSRPVIVWGAGRPTRKRADHLQKHGVEIAGYIDIDARKIGRVLGGKPVIGPAALPLPGEIFVLGYVPKRGARELARGHLCRRGFEEGRDFLMAA